jgi:hypothetical protein
MAIQPDQWYTTRWHAADVQDDTLYWEARLCDVAEGHTLSTHEALALALDINKWQIALKV